MVDAPRQRDRPRILCRFSSTHWSCAQVYGGYEGCVGENGYLPCAQDGFGGLSATDKFYLYNTSTGECTETGKTMMTRAFWLYCPLSCLKVNSGALHQWTSQG